MYPSIRPPANLEADLPEDEFEAAEADGAAPRGRFGVGRNVYLIGLTSLVTDISSEMITAILPLYLVFQLRLTPVQFGFFNGFYLAIAGLMTILGGVIADRLHRYKEVAGAGYGLSAACKMGLVAAQNAPVPATGVLFADRVGKGMRVAPRDALISLSAARSRLGTAFGVHRALDTAGALIGPIVAFFVLEAAPRAYDAVFVISFLFAILGLGILVLFVENKKPHGRGIELPSLRESLRLLRLPEFRALVVAGFLLGLFTVADAFIYLTFQNEADFLSKFFPLLYVGTAVSYLVLAIPAGRIADRVGRARVFMVGYVLLLAVYGVLLLPSPGEGELLLMLAMLGGFYACTDGVFAAMVAASVSDEVRTSGMAVARTAAALAGFVSSIAFGLLWSAKGPTQTVAIFAVCMVATIAITAALLRVARRRYG